MKFGRAKPVQTPVVVSTRVLEYDCGKMSVPGTGCEMRWIIVPAATADVCAVHPRRTRPAGRELSWTSVTSDVTELMSHCAPFTVGSTSRLNEPWQVAV
jgi:hypothetical protein